MPLHYPTISWHFLVVPAGSLDPLSMVAAAKIWATALRQLAELPYSERTSPSEVIVPGEEVLPLPVLNQFSALPSIRPAEWHRVVTDLKVSGQSAARRCLGGLAWQVGK